jgi:glycosyltransferase involved in cell wall biosynthesis
MKATLDSVIAQSVPPVKWVIVDDGSTDATPDILKEYENAHEWIEVIKRVNRGHRAVGSGVVDAFYAGFETIDLDVYDFLCKLDLDLRLPEKYFETLLVKMHTNPRIGTCSGKAYIERNGEWVSERHGDETSIGASKFYRISCYREIGGFVRDVNWDGIDCHQCRMRGWIACSFDEPQLRFEHLRPMGSSQKGIITGRIRYGYGQYYMGTGFLWIAVTAIYRLTEKPYFFGSLAILYGWLKSRVLNLPRYQEEGFREFLQKYHRRSLLVGKKKAVAEIDERNQKIFFNDGRSD